LSVFALIPAAGSGSRLSKKQPKQYAALAGKPMLWHAIRAVCMPPVESVFVVLAPGDKAFARHDWKAFKGKLEPLYCGGETRVGVGVLVLRDGSDVGYQAPATQNPT